MLGTPGCQPGWGSPSPQSLPEPLPPRVVAQVVPLGTQPGNDTFHVASHSAAKGGWEGVAAYPVGRRERETEGGMEEGVTYADLRLPPTPGNGTLLPAPGTPTLLAGPLPSCSPLTSAGPFPQRCSPRSFLLGFLSQTAPLQPRCRLPALRVGGRRGSRVGDSHCTPVPQCT